MKCDVCGIVALNCQRSLAVPFVLFGSFVVSFKTPRAIIQKMSDEQPIDDSANESYTAKDLEHLSDLEHVRERPSMYIGDTTPRGLHHLVYEVVDNSIDEAMAGHATTVSVIIT